MKPLQVTKAFLPPLSELMGQLERVWASGQLTNNGALVVELEQKLEATLGVERLVALAVEGPVVTTPFSYVATTSSLLWRRCTPVFVDVDPDTLCIDPAQTEAEVGRGARAVLATHVYGNSCDVERLEGLSRAGVPVIYDAAHAFGVRLAGRSLLSYGDVSSLSFHATKLFHTAEGGALVARTAELHERLKLVRSFGHVGDEHYCLGTNGKMSELHAAVGLVMLGHLAGILERRKHATERYFAKLSGAPVRFPRRDPRLEYNHAYFPVIFRTEAVQQRVRAALNARSIFPRRYFYPSLNTLPYVPDKRACPVSEEAARTVLCLPLSAELSDAEVDEVCELVHDNAA
jgi:dTDP-4-amino-4,6-dideoxygalactose transaminase